MQCCALVLLMQPCGRTRTHAHTHTAMQHAEQCTLTALQHLHSKFGLWTKSQAGLGNHGFVSEASQVVLLQTCQAMTQ